MTNSLQAFFKWKKNLHSFPQATIDFLVIGIVLLVISRLFCWLVCPVIPYFALLYLFGIVLTMLGGFFLVLTVARFIYKKIKP